MYFLLETKKELALLEVEEVKADGSVCLQKQPSLHYLKIRCLNIEDVGAMIMHSIRLLPIALGLSNLNEAV